MLKLKLKLLKPNLINEKIPLKILIKNFYSNFSITNPIVFYNFISLSEKSKATSDLLLDEEDERSDYMDEEEGKFILPIKIST